MRRAYFFFLGVAGFFGAFFAMQPQVLHIAGLLVLRAESGSDRRYYRAGRSLVKPQFHEVPGP